MTHISTGAEAVLTKKGDTILKHRLAKGYRLPELDEKIRKFRTRREARILRKLSGRVNVPRVLEEGADTLVLEFITATPLRDALTAAHCQKTGEQVGAMHAMGVIHGDLTPSNVLVAEKVVLVDFGLAYSSTKLEDFATDLHVFEELVSADHFAAFFNGYAEKNPQAADVRARLEKLKTRGRYRNEKRKKKP
ncbi:MAG: KEOPS complex kinase/ATPase Bud32 [Candidatus Micrarchaeota archaeon]|nr:KEOPS complex kinase/ATPase Bud32 [Candidatus Micrarchaeota archaeon]